MARRRDGRSELVLRFIAHTCEDVRQTRTPNLRIALSAARFREYETLLQMALGALDTRVSAKEDVSFVVFQPAYFEDVEFGALGETLET
ncbi:hypothetical protein BKA60DRAFT_641090 [Fusarium oxysporum]|nr:hypothetical protein BKA60DRAFT_641090 [Fusarium oxysporum]